MHVIYCRDPFPAPFSHCTYLLLCIFIEWKKNYLYDSVLFFYFRCLKKWPRKHFVLKFLLFLTSHTVWQFIEFFHSNLIILSHIQTVTRLVLKMLTIYLQGQFNLQIIYKKPFKSGKKNKQTSIFETDIFYLFANLYNFSFYTFQCVWVQPNCLQ